VQTEKKNHNAADVDQGVEARDDVQEENLRWLLDEDRSEPEEKLFILADDAYEDVALSDFEAEFAGRPMFRGKADGDDISCFVSEEIVISSEEPLNDIYPASSGVAPQPAAPGATPQWNEHSKIVHSRQAKAVAAPVAAPGVSDGVDIFGLTEDDDIGDKFITIKRIKRARAETEAAAATAEGERADAQPPSAPSAEEATALRPVQPAAATGSGAAPAEPGEVQDPRAPQDAVAATMDCTQPALPESHAGEGEAVAFAGSAAGDDADGACVGAGSVDQVDTMPAGPEGDDDLDEVFAGFGAIDGVETATVTPLAGDDLGSVFADLGAFDEFDTALAGPGAGDDIDDAFAGFGADDEIAAAFAGLGESDDSGQEIRAAGEGQVLDSGSAGGVSSATEVPQEPEPETELEASDTDRQAGG
jgi:hypothetical protein